MGIKCIVIATGFALFIKVEAQVITNKAPLSVNHLTTASFSYAPVLPNKKWETLNAQYSMNSDEKTFRTNLAASPVHLMVPRTEPAGTPGQTNLVWRVVWRGVETAALMTAPAAAEKAVPQSDLEPGIYKTEPYACIVIVPAKHLDDEIAVGAGTPPTDTAPAMPMVKPELHFIPLNSK